ncbi:MAG: hypothetical protein ABIH00_06870, partial [Armatimonadota bacterium]
MSVLPEFALNKLKEKGFFIIVDNKAPVSGYSAFLTEANVIVADTLDEGFVLKSAFEVLHRDKEIWGIISYEYEGMLSIIKDRLKIISDVSKGATRKDAELAGFNRFIGGVTRSAIEREALRGRNIEDDTLAEEIIVQLFSIYFSDEIIAGAFNQGCYLRKAFESEEPRLYLYMKNMIEKLAFRKVSDSKDSVTLPKRPGDPGSFRETRGGNLNDGRAAAGSKKNTVESAMRSAGIEGIEYTYVYALLESLRENVDNDKVLTLCHDLINTHKKSSFLAPTELSGIKVLAVEASAKKVMAEYNVTGVRLGDINTSVNALAVGIREEIALRLPELGLKGNYNDFFSDIVESLEGVDSSLALEFKKELAGEPVNSIEFTCSANDIRSRGAELIFEKLLEERYGEDAGRFKVASSGTAIKSTHNEQPYTYSTHGRFPVRTPAGYQRQRFTLASLNEADLVIATNDASKDIHSMAKDRRVDTRKVLTIELPGSVGSDGDLEVFNRILDYIDYRDKVREEFMPSGGTGSFVVRSHTHGNKPGKDPGNAVFEENRTSDTFIDKEAKHYPGMRNNINGGPDREEIINKALKAVGIEEAVEGDSIFDICYGIYRKYDIEKADLFLSEIEIAENKNNCKLLTYEERTVIKGTIERAYKKALEQDLYAIMDAIDVNVEGSGSVHGMLAQVYSTYGWEKAAEFYNLVTDVQAQKHNLSPLELATFKLTFIKTAVKNVMTEYGLDKKYSFNRISSIFKETEYTIPYFAVSLRELILSRRSGECMLPEEHHIEFFKKIIALLENADKELADEFKRALPGNPVRKILVVCIGNEVRSPGSMLLLEKMLEKKYGNNCEIVVKSASSKQDSMRTGEPYIYSTLPEGLAVTIPAGYQTVPFDKRMFDSCDVIFVTRDSYMDVAGMANTADYFYNRKKVIEVGLPQQVTAEADLVPFNQILDYITQRERVCDEFGSHAPVQSQAAGRSKRETGSQLKALPAEYIPQVPARQMIPDSQRTNIIEILQNRSRKKEYKLELLNRVIKEIYDNEDISSYIKSYQGMTLTIEARVLLHSLQELYIELRDVIYETENVSLSAKEILADNLILCTVPEEARAPLRRELAKLPEELLGNLKKSNFLISIGEEVESDFTRYNNHFKLLNLKEGEDPQKYGYKLSLFSGAFEALYNDKESFKSVEDIYKETEALVAEADAGSCSDFLRGIINGMELLSKSTGMPRPEGFYRAVIGRLFASYYAGESMIVDQSVDISNNFQRSESELYSIMQKMHERLSSGTREEGSDIKGGAWPSRMHKTTHPSIVRGGIGKDLGPGIPHDPLNPRPPGGGAACFSKAREGMFPSGEGKPAEKTDKITGEEHSESGQFAGVGFKGLDEILPAKDLLDEVEKATLKFAGSESVDCQIVLRNLDRCNFMLSHLMSLARTGKCEGLEGNIVSTTFDYYHIILKKANMLSDSGKAKVLLKFKEEVFPPVREAETGQELALELFLSLTEKYTESGKLKYDNTPREYVNLEYIARGKKTFVQCLFELYFSDNLKDGQAERNFGNLLKGIANQENGGDSPGDTPATRTPGPGTSGTKVTGDNFFKNANEKLNNAARDFAVGLGIMPQPVTPQGIQMPVFDKVGGVSGPRTPAVMAMSGGGKGGKSKKGKRTQKNRGKAVDSPAGRHDESLSGCIENLKRIVTKECTDYDLSRRELLRKLDEKSESIVRENNLKSRDAGDKYFYHYNRERRAMEINGRIRSKLTELGVSTDEIDRLLAELNYALPKRFREAVEKAQEEYLEKTEEFFKDLSPVEKEINRMLLGTIS